MVATTMCVCLILLNRMLKNGQGGKFYPACIWPKSKQKQNTSLGMQMGKLGLTWPGYEPLSSQAGLLSLDRGLISGLL